MSVLFALKLLRKQLAASLVHNEKLGIFKKPDGEINTAWLRAEIDKAERYGKWSKESTLKSRSLADIVQDAIFIINN